MMKVQSSKFKVQNYLFISLFTVYCSLFTVYGCGYSIHGKASLPFDSIQLGKIENKTVEPKLQDMLYKALTEEFLKQGVVVSPGAGHKLNCILYQFDLRVLSEQADIATEYEVIISGNFTLVDPAGNIREFKKTGSPFIISFSAPPGPLNQLIALKELASERAMKDMAMEIVAVLMYR